MPARRSSLAPLWLTLGFAAGLTFGWAAFRDTTSPRAAAAAPVVAKAAFAEPERTEIPVNAGTLRAAEQSFERWGGYAIWENDVTEIAAWDARRKRHSDFYEVRRAERKFYFRSLTALCRPLIDHGVSTAMPIAFTEPQWMRDRFYRENPNYDPASTPRVELPPRPPERHASDIPRGHSTGTQNSSVPIVPYPPRITPGAGG